MKANRLLTLSAPLLGVLLPSIASAHPGHATSGLVDGLAHPLLGLDHLGTALLVGAWAAQRGGALRFALPGSFVLALLLGVFAAASLPLQVAAAEQLIAASLLVLGALVALAWHVNGAACVALCAGFAFFHGLAHGGEQPAGAALAAYGVGLATSTLALAVTATVVGNALRRHRAQQWLRWFGTACACGGLALLA
jgi:urease accessory protein